MKNLIQKSIASFGINSRFNPQVLTWTKVLPVEWYGAVDPATKIVFDREYSAILPEEVVAPAGWDYTGEEKYDAIIRLFAKFIPLSAKMLTHEQAIEACQGRDKHLKHLFSREMLCFPHQRILPSWHEDIAKLNPEYIYPFGEDSIWFSGNKFNSQARIESLQNEFYFWRSLGLQQSMLSPVQLEWVASQELTTTDSWEVRFLKAADFKWCNMSEYFLDVRESYTDMKHIQNNRFPLKTITPAVWAEHVVIPPEKLNNRITIASRLSGVPFLKVPKAGVLLVEVPKELELMLFGSDGISIPDGVIYSIGTENIKVMDRQGYEANMCYGDKLRGTGNGGNCVPIKGTNVPLHEVKDSLFTRIVEQYADGSLQALLNEKFPISEEEKTKFRIADIGKDIMSFPEIHNVLMSRNGKITIDELSQMLVDILPLIKNVSTFKGAVFFALESGSLKSPCNGKLRITKFTMKDMIENPPFLVETRSMERVMDSPKISNHVYQYLLSFHDKSYWGDIIPQISEETRSILEGTASSVQYAAMTLYPRKDYESSFNKEVLTSAIQEMFDGTRNIPDPQDGSALLIIVKDGKTVQGMIPRPGLKVIQSGGIDVARIRRMMTKYIIDTYNAELHYPTLGVGGVLLGMEDVPMGCAVVSPTVWNKIGQFLVDNKWAAMLYWPMKYSALFKVEVSVDYSLSGCVIAMNKEMHLLAGADDDGDNNFLIVEPWLVNAAPTVDQLIPIRDHLNNRILQIEFTDTLEIRSVAERNISSLYNMKTEELSKTDILTRIIQQANGVGGTFQWRDLIHATLDGDLNTWVRLGTVCHASLDGLKVSTPINVPSIVSNSSAHTAKLLGVAPSKLFSMYNSKTGKPMWYQPTGALARFKFEYQIFSRRIKFLADTDAEPLLEQFQEAMNNPSDGFFGEILKNQLRGRNLKIRSAITNAGMVALADDYRSRMIGGEKTAYTVDQEIRNTVNVLNACLEMRVDALGFLLEKGSKEEGTPLPLNAKRFAEYAVKQLREETGKANSTIITTAIYSIMSRAKGAGYTDSLLGLLRYLRLKIAEKIAEAEPVSESIAAG